MGTLNFPVLEPRSILDTRAALHAYSRVLGAWLKKSRARRKHWWHASLRPSLMGLCTGVLDAGVDFELELNLRESAIQGRTSVGDGFSEPLTGQPAEDVERAINAFMTGVGVDARDIPDAVPDDAGGFVGYSAEAAVQIAHTISAVAAAMRSFRAGIREETSPIQLWPHHFDLSMLWLPGDKITGQDPANEEYADKQMNFGFTFGDEGIPEPYFYVTAYPEPDALPSYSLPAGTAWQTDGFSGAVLPYRNLVAESDPSAYLLNLWDGLVSAGRKHMTVEAEQGDAA